MTRRLGPPRLLHVVDAAKLAVGLEREGLADGRCVVVLVGGPAGADDAQVDALASMLADAVVPALGDRGVLVDGGTDAGVMRAAGRARAAGPDFPLVGVAAVGTISAPWEPRPSPTPQNSSRRTHSSCQRRRALRRALLAIKGEQEPT